MNGDSVPDGVAFFADILLVTPAAPNYVNEIFFTSHDMEYFALNVFPHWKVNLFSVIKCSLSPQFDLLHFCFYIWGLANITKFCYSYKFL